MGRVDGCCRVRSEIRWVLMVRDLEPIGHQEPLFRCIGVEHLNGDRILPIAVEVPCCSVLRANFVTLESVLPPAKRPSDTGVAQITVASLPQSLQWPQNPAPGDEPASWQFAAVDMPEEGLLAHAEVHFSKKGEAVRRAVNNRSLRLLAQDLLAREFRVVRRPVEP